MRSLDDLHRRRMEPQADIGGKERGGNSDTGWSVTKPCLETFVPYSDIAHRALLHRSTQAVGFSLAPRTRTTGRGRRVNGPINPPSLIYKEWNLASTQTGEPSSRSGHHKRIHQSTGGGRTFFEWGHHGWWVVQRDARKRAAWRGVR